jgi:hypothetical protein
MSEDRLTEFAALLDEFVAAQRRAALADTKKQRITIVRNIGQVAQCTFETVVDEGTSGEDIWRLLAPIDAALDRLKAKSDLSDHLNLTLNEISQIELTVKKMARQRHEWAVQNERASHGRRQAIVGLTGQQEAQLIEDRRAIRLAFEKIAEKLKAADEVKRILAGENPFDLLADQVSERLDRVRGERPADDEAA